MSTISGDTIAMDIVGAEAKRAAETATLATPPKDRGARTGGRTPARCV